MGVSGGFTGSCHWLSSCQTEARPPASGSDDRQALMPSCSGRTATPVGMMPGTGLSAGGCRRCSHSRSKAATPEDPGTHVFLLLGRVLGLQAQRHRLTGRSCLLTGPTTDGSPETLLPLDSIEIDSTIWPDEGRLSLSLSLPSERFRGSSGSHDPLSRMGRPAELVLQQQGSGPAWLPWRITQAACATCTPTFLLLACK